MKSFLVITLFTVFISLANATENHTYESLGIDSIQKQQIEAKIIENSSLPIINISTRNNSELILSRDIYTDCVVDVLNVDDDHILKEQSAGVKVRGNSSAYYGDVEQIKANSVPYIIKFSKRTNLLGLHHGEKFKDWVLLKSGSKIIRHDYAYRMGRAVLGDDYYISDTTIVKVYVNDVLQGTYSLCEQNKIDEKKVNVSVPEKNYNGTDIGYYFEIDNCYEDEENKGKYFEMDYEKASVKDILGIERPFWTAYYTLKNEFYCQDQLDFIKNYTNNVFKIIYLATEKNIFKTFDENYNLVNSTYTSAQETISSVIDIDSVVNMYIIYENVHDYDVGEGSFYFAIDFSKESKIKKLQMISPWDFDWTYHDSPRRYWAGAFCEDSFIESNGDRSNPWFIELVKQEWFHELVSKKWEAVSSSVRDALAYDEQFINDYLDDLLVINKNVVKDADTIFEWIRQRLDWMDEAFTVGNGIVIPNEEQPIKAETSVSTSTTISTPILTSISKEIIGDDEVIKEIDTDEEIEITEEADINEEDSINELDSAEDN